MKAYEYLLSLATDDCYYLYSYEKEQFVARVTRNKEDGKYKDGYTATDLFCITCNTEDISTKLMSDWNFKQVALHSDVVLLGFYPNLATVTKEFGEYLI